MRQTQLVMGMPVTVEVTDFGVDKTDLEAVFEFFKTMDKKYSPYKETSEVSLINRGKLKPAQYSREMKHILDLCEQTKQETGGYFDIYHNGKMDPSGLVKGWAIFNAGQILKSFGRKNYYVDAGGDAQISGLNSKGEKWVIGIRNPFNRRENVKIIALTDAGIATSGTAIRGNHIYNPREPGKTENDLMSLTVIGPDIYEADRMATPAFAMGPDGINFIQSRPGLEGYAINKQGVATYTSGWNKYLAEL